MTSKTARSGQAEDHARSIGGSVLTSSPTLILFLLLLFSLVQAGAPAEIQVSPSTCCELQGHRRASTFSARAERAQQETTLLLRTPITSTFDCLVPFCACYAARLPPNLPATHSRLPPSCSTSTAAIVSDPEPIRSGTLLSCSSPSVQRLSLQHNLPQYGARSGRRAGGR